MTPRFWQWIGLALVTIAVGGGCLVSNLSNGFDPKTPGGILGYLGLGSPKGSPSDCSFDAGRFGSCAFGP